jgi:hypothetical protein
VLCSLQKRSKSSKLAPKVYEGFLLGYDANSRAYRVFNMTTDCVETTCDKVFDKTNGSQKEHVDLDLVDATRPKLSTSRTTPNDTTPAQGLDQDNHEEEDEHNDQVQEGSNDQGGDEDDGDKGEEPPHL